MALGFSFGGGDGGNDIIPIVKFDCRAGRMFRRDRVNGEYVQVDVTKGFKAVVDFENVETGWINFDTGTAPDFHVARYGTTVPPQPSEKHRPGVRLLVKLGKDSGGDVRELASTAKAFLRGIDELHSAYVAGKDANAGKLPVAELSDTIAITTGEGARKSTNYAPVFKIVGWVARPADLIWKAKSASAPAAAPAAAAPVAAAAPPFGSDDDFG